MEKDSPKTPKKFDDCVKLYAECEIPKEHTYGMKKRRRYFLKKKNQTVTEEETTLNPNVDTADIVTKYVKNQE